MIDVGRGVLKGATGIVSKPVEGAKQDGAAGAAKGVGKGVVGVPLKPAIGAVDATTDLAIGIRNTTSVARVSPLPTRLPRVCGTTTFNGVPPYDEKAAEGLLLLRSASQEIPANANKTPGDLMATLAMVGGVGLGTIANVIHPYPTQAEDRKSVV